MSDRGTTPVLDSLSGAELKDIQENNSIAVVDSRIVAVLASPDTEDQTSARDEAHVYTTPPTRKLYLPPPLNYARTAFSRVPFYVWVAIFCSLAGFLFGFDTGSIGPITVMLQFTQSYPSISPTLQGLIVSSILIPASLSSACAGPISDRFSRTRTMAVGALLFAVGSAVECGATSLAMLFVGRCIAGIGEGQFWGVTAVYVCEIAPASARGRVANAIQLGDTVGIALGYFVCYGSSRLDGTVAWRFPFGLQAIVATVFAIGLPFLPHSPRWLTHVGREAEATEAWRRLGVNPIEAEKEEELIGREDAQARGEVQAVHAGSAGPRRPSSRGGWRTELMKVWRKDIRQRTMLGVFLMGFQQLSGIDGVLYYAPVLFAKAGLSSTEASFLASGVSGLLLIACCIVTQIYSDKWGRRPTIIFGGATISFSMFTIGILYATHATDYQAGRWAVVVLIYLFVLAFGVAWSSLIRVYVTEIQPMETRAAATSLAQTANWVINWVIAFSTPLFLDRTTSGPYFLFGTSTLLAVLVCIAFQSESRGVSLEGIEAVFQVSPWRGILGKARLAKLARGRRRGLQGVDIPLRPVGLSPGST